MASNLGSMVLEMSANFGRFQSDMGKIVQSASESADRIVAKFEKVGAAIGVGLGAHEFKEWIAGAIEAQDQALKLSQKIGVAVDSIAGLSSAAAKSDIDAQAFQASMVKLAKSASEAAGGVAASAVAYKAMGVNVKDANGNIKSSDVLLGELSDKFAGYKDGIEKTNLAITLFGKAGANMIPLLNGGSEAIKRQIQLAKDLGVAVGTEAAKGAEEFNDKLKDLSLVSKGVANQIATGLLPALNKLADEALRFFTSDTWKSWLEKIKSAAMAVADNLDRILNTIKLMGTLAADYIGVRLVGSIVTATAKMIELTVATLAANSAAADMGLSFGKGVGASIKSIGILTTALGSVGAAVAGWQIGNYLRDNFVEARVAGLAFVEAMLVGWENLKAGGQLVWITFEKAVDQAVAGAKTALSGLLAVMSNVQLFRGDFVGAGALATLSEEFAHAKSNAAGFDSQMRGVIVTYNKNVTGIRDLTSSLNEGAAAQQDMSTFISASGKAAKDAAPQIAGLKEANDNAAKAAQQLAEMFAKDAEVIAALNGKLDPVQAKYQEYVKAIIAANDEYQKEIALAQAAGAGDAALAQAKDILAQKTKGAQAALQSELDVMVKQNDIVGKLFERLRDDASLIGLTDREREQQQAVNEATNAWLELNPAVQAALVLQGKLDPTTQAGTEAIKAQVGALHDQQQAAQLATEAARGWQSIWSQAANGVADTFAKVLVNGGSMFKGLRDLAKQTVEQIIAYFAKLSVINPILNAIFGGQSGWGQLAQFGGSAMGGGSGFNELGGGTSLIGQFLGGGSGGGSSSGFSLFSPSSWVDAGKNLWNGFSTMWGGGGGNLLDANGVMQYQPGSGASIANGGYSSGFGQALGVAGGLYAGYNRYQQAGGGVGGVVGGATYAAGTYALGAGISSVVAGSGFAAGVSGAFAAIPVVGWIALAAMIVDKFSGGKLFGTKGKVVGGNQTTNIEDDGSFDINTSYTTKGQKAFFGGAYWKEHSTPTDPETMKAAQDFVDGLKKGTEEFAKSVGAVYTGIVGGSFNTSFDKNGKPTGTTDTVLGVTRKGETQEQFAERLQADSFLQVLDSMGLGASQFVAGLQDDADKLFAGVQDFAQAVTVANTDLGNGFHFLALSSDATLKDVMAFVEGLQAGGESLTQTYTRLAQAQTQYNQFTGQFKPTTTYVDDFEAGMSQLYHTMLQNIDTANALAIAAGASGAAQEDLTNIQSTAARQMAALTVQLENSAQSLAFSLGLTTQGSLDQVNQAIADIINSAGGANDVADAATEATAATRQFGNTIGAVAKQANDAINLLLSNLSPLNDQQKLQIALQGLRAGTVSQSDVLEIGRRLYASSQAYTDLFAQVQQYGPKGGGGGGSYRGTVTVLEGSYKAGTTAAEKAQASAPPTNWTGTEEQWKSTGLTAEKWAALSEKDQKKLEDLLNKQATLKDAKSLQDFNTLGQQIAEIASAKGEDWKAVINEMGINAADLEKGLGLKTDEELAKYFKNLQDQQDSAKENTQSIVDAINLLPSGIVDALSGKDTPGRAVPLRPAPATTPDPAPAATGPITLRNGGPVGDGNNRNRNLTDGDVEAIGAVFTRSLRMTGDSIANSYVRPSARIAVR